MYRKLRRVYGNTALCRTTYRDQFRWFKDIDFNKEGRLRKGIPKIIEETELKVLLEEDP